MENECVVSCAFREPYVTHNQVQSKLVDVAMYSFVNALPYKEGLVSDNIVIRFQQSLYGFKPHAIQKMRDNGYTKIIWLDPSVYPVTPVSNMMRSLRNTNMLIRSGEHELSVMTGQKALDWFGVTKEEIKGVKHIAGTIYGFNFEKPETVKVFELWKQAEEAGIFGTQDDLNAGHWCDESCLALAMYKVGVKQKFCNFKYLNQKDGIR